MVSNSMANMFNISTWCTVHQPLVYDTSASGVRYISTWCKVHQHLVYDHIYLFCLFVMLCLTHHTDYCLLKKMWSWHRLFLNLFLILKRSIYKNNQVSTNITHLVLIWWEQQLPEKVGVHLSSTFFLCRQRLYDSKLSWVVHFIFAGESFTL